MALPAASSGAMVHIKTVTASSDSAITFVNGVSDVVLDSTYKTYIFRCTNIHPSSDNQKFNVNITSDISNVEPYIMYMYFHSIINA